MLTLTPVKQTKKKAGIFKESKKNMERPRVINPSVINPMLKLNPSRLDFIKTISDLEV